MKKTLAFLMMLILFCTAASLTPSAQRVDRPVVEWKFEQSTEAGDVQPAPAGPPWWETTAMDSDGNKVFDILDRSGEEFVNIYVDYDHAPVESDLALLAGYEITDVFEPVCAVGLWGVPRTDLPVLANLPGVVMLEPRGTPLLYSDIATPNAKVRESGEYSPETAWELGYFGSGVSIAVVDTGVDNEHPSIKGKWLGGVDLSKPLVPLLNPQDGTKDADDTNGHGTTCTGIAMGTGAPDGTYMGAAPEARLVDVRIGTMIGYAPGELLQHNYDASLQGIFWCMEFMDHEWPGAGPNKGIDIISLSWGIDVGGNSDGSDVYSRALDSAVESGIIVINAAGNSGPDNTGFDGFAASSQSIKIAASDDLDTITRDDDEIASYSSRGPRDDNGDGNPYDELIPDLAAPGTGITQCQFDRIGDGSGNGYGPRGSGTSYATPCVAGVAALMKEANEDLDNYQIKGILQFTAERKGEPTYPELDPFWNRDWGYGLVDAYRAVKTASEVDAKFYEPDLKCHITEVENQTHGFQVTGMAWALTQSVFAIELSIDGEVVEVIPVDEEDPRISMGGDPVKINWTTAIDTRDYEPGNHTLGARAVINDGYSLTDTREVVVQKYSEDEPLAKIPLAIIIGIFLVLGAALAVFYLWKRNKA